MALRIQKQERPKLSKIHHEPEVGLRFEKGEKPYADRVYPTGHDEPLFIRFHGNVGVRAGKQTWKSEANFVVTRARVVLILKGGMNAKGLAERLGEVAFVSVDRADLAAPVKASTFTGKVKSLSFPSVDGTFTFDINFVPDFVRLLEVMDPAYAAQLDAGALVDVQQKAAEKRASEEAAAAVEKRAQDQRRDEIFNASGGRGGRGLLDHRRTWHYRVADGPEECVAAFREAFTGRGGVLAKAKWDLARTSDGATATYQGRKGLVAIGSILSETAAAEEAGAVGSEIRFVARASGEGSECSMWLAASASRVGFTNDGRFFKPYMRAVETALRRRDPNVAVAKE